MIVTLAQTSVPVLSIRVRPAVFLPKPVPVTVSKVPPALPVAGVIVRRFEVTVTFVMLAYPVG